MKTMFSIQSDQDPIVKQPQSFLDYKKLYKHSLNEYLGAIIFAEWLDIWT